MHPRLNASQRRGRTREGKVVTVDGAEHEILMETDPLRNQFWERFDALADGAAPRD